MLLRVWREHVDSLLGEGRGVGFHGRSGEEETAFPKFLLMGSEYQLTALLPDVSQSFGCVLDAGVIFISLERTKNRG